jgi:hypothetical protein
MKNQNIMFKFELLQNDNFEIVNKGVKHFYNLDGQNSLIDWVKESLYKPKNNPLPVFSSLQNTKNSVRNFGESIGYCYFTANRVEYNQRYVCVMTTPFSISRGFHITKQNFEKFLVSYASRSLIKESWINEKDEYKTPNVDSLSYKQFLYDSLVVSLFSNNSTQASYRNFEHMGGTYNIKNEFFWMSRDRIKELADNMGYDELYNDARTDSDRHVYKILFGPENFYDKLSPDAKAVLDKAMELVELSMEMRQEMANDDNHLNSWDAGYAQLKLVWKKYFPEQFKEFRQLYKNMEDRMRPLVYELGFLMK